MKHVEKMYLVSRHQMEQLQDRTPTIGTTAPSQLDDDMWSILQSLALSEDIKIKRYNSVLQRFLRLFRQNESQKNTLNLIHLPEDFRQLFALLEPSVQPPPYDPTKQEILDGVSTHYKKNAELLLNK